MTTRETITGSERPACSDCDAEGEVVQAAYRLAGDIAVCDTHLCIRAEEA